MNSPSFVTLLLCLLGLFAASCQRESIPQLVTLQEINPQAVDIDESLEITGIGFPIKKTAHVTFRGSLLRPGQPPERDQAIEADASSDQEAKLQVPLTQALCSRFYGGEEAVHTTFRGDVEVSFPPLTPGALPITGTLTHVVIDIRASHERKPLLQARRTEADQALALLGLRIDDSASTPGSLVVAEVASGSAAEEAGVAAGDALIAMNDLSLLEKADFIPSGKQRFVTLSIRRKGAMDSLERQVALRGYKPHSANNFFSVALVLGVAGAWILFFASPLAKVLTWLERWTITSMVAHPHRIRARISNQFSLLTRTSAHTKQTSELMRIALSGAFLLTSCLCSLLPFSHALFAEGIDAGSVLLVLGFALGVLRLGRVEGTALQRGSFSRKLYAGLCAISCQLPSILAAVCILVLTGSLRIDDVVRSQAGAPWRWHLAEVPFAPLLLLLFFLPLAIESTPASTALPEATETALIPHTTSSSALQNLFLESVEWASLFVHGSLGAALFLGGWQVPCIDRAAQDASLGWQTLGALIFLVKTWLFVLLLTALRAALPRVVMAHATGPLWRLFMPLSGLGLVLTVSWVAWDPEPTLHRLIASGAFTFFCLLSAFIIHRLVMALRHGNRTPAPMHANPFL